MKLLVVCQYFYPEQFKVNDICFELVKLGYDVTVLTGLPNYPYGVIPKDYRWFKRRYEDINGVRVIRSCLIGRGQGQIRLALNYVSFAVSSSITALFMKKDFDLVLVYQLSPITMALPALLLKKLTGKPLLLYCQDLWPESIVAAGLKTEGFIYTTLLGLSRYIYKRADKLAISSKLFEKYFKEVIGINGDIQYLPVYAESLFENIEAGGTKGNVINLVFAGNIGEMQSVETIIKAANELKNLDKIIWHIVGDGSDRINCEELATKCGLNNVIFYGQRPIEEMPDFYSMADAFLVTLKANKEISYTLPNKVQSYMATGKPIIGAIDGETRLVIEEAGCGLCCKAEDHIALAGLVRGFAFNTENHSIMGKNARKYYRETFDKKIFMKSLIEFLTIENRVSDYLR
ncbi:glycosyltransferase family 4 protein [Syntrophomonas wolfei]|uniref:glycosyltransferase family 4 protein n=1 Tax=Syntrophomonas wolfei TaxID=863 RepID=UPI0007740E3C|nr:glycosyltransferase family 4 protein [Syntrophomonas wolfei]